MLKTKGTDKITGKTNFLTGFFNGIKKFLPPPSLQTTVRKKRHGHLLAKNPKKTHLILNIYTFYWKNLSPPIFADKKVSLPGVKESPWPLLIRLAGACSRKFYFFPKNNFWTPFL